MSEVITIEVVGKFGPKANGAWYGLKRPVKPTDFTAGSTYLIETENYDYKGRKGVNITSFKKVDNEAVPTEREVKNEIKKVVGDLNEVKKSVKTEMTYDEQKNRRILRQGIIQAVVQSPSLASFPITDANGLVAMVKDISNQLIEFVQE